MIVILFVAFALVPVMIGGSVIAWLMWVAVWLVADELERRRQPVLSAVPVALESHDVEVRVA